MRHPALDLQAVAREKVEGSVESEFSKGVDLRGSATEPTRVGQQAQDKIELRVGGSPPESGHKRSSDTSVAMLGRNCQDKIL